MEYRLVSCTMDLAHTHYHLWASEVPDIGCPSVTFGIFLGIEVGIQNDEVD